MYVKWQYCAALWNERTEKSWQMCKWANKIHFRHLRCWENAIYEFRLRVCDAAQKLQPNERMKSQKHGPINCTLFRFMHAMQICRSLPIWINWIYPMQTMYTNGCMPAGYLLCIAILWLIWTSNWKSSVNYEWALNLILRIPRMQLASTSKCSMVSGICSIWEFVRERYIWKCFYWYSFAMHIVHTYNDIDELVLRIRWYQSNQ